MAKTSLRFQDRANDFRCKRYYQWAYDRYWETNRRHLYHYDHRAKLYDEPTVDLPRVHKLYASGVKFGYLNIPYTAFEPYLTGITPDTKLLERYFRKAPKKPPYRYRWVWSIDRVQAKYRRNPEHLKKETNENPKTAWRVHRKLKKDRAKKGWYRCNISPHDKRVANQRLRAWERQLIHAGNWEGFHPHRRKKLTDDWW